MKSRAFNTVFASGAINYLILAAGMLVSIQMRLEISLGRELGQDYPLYILEVYLLLLPAGLVAHLIAWFMGMIRPLARVLALGHQFRILLLQVVMTTLLVLALLPELSQLQLLYFTGTSALIGVFVIVFPRRLRSNAYVPVSIGDDMRKLYANRHLLRMWLRYRIQTRYSQTVLGIMWIVLLPLAESLVLAFALSQLLGVRTANGVNFIVFLLSGQVVFRIFEYTVLRGQAGILSTMGLIKQVYFPREIVILLVLGEALVDFVFTFIAMLVINAMFGVWPNIYYVFLPLPIVLMICLAVGTSLIISWLAMIVRDIQQLIGVVMQLLFYATVFYSAERVPERYQFIPLVNPLSAVVESFRDVVIYNRPPDLLALVYPAALSLAVLYTGYIYFKVNEDRLVDFA